MRKFLAIMLAGLILMLCACGDKKSDSSSKIKKERSISDVDKLKNANEKAKIIYTKINNLIYDYELDYKDGKLSDIESSMNNKAIEIVELKDSTNPFDNALYKVLNEGEYNGDEKTVTYGTVFFNVRALELDDKTSYYVYYAQWADDKDSGIVGQYPDSELDSKIVHRIGEKFEPGVYQGEH